jgi:hypothetical protein
MSISWIAEPPALLVNVTTVTIDDVVPIAVLGNEKVDGLNVSCDETADAAAPSAPELELELELEDEALTLEGTGGTGRLLQAAVSEVHVGNTAIKSQWMRQPSIRDSYI